jgi:signal transduction histidine kinase/CheY-like chemotaxis protein
MSNVGTICLSKEIHCDPTPETVGSDAAPAVIETDVTVKPDEAPTQVKLTGLSSYRMAFVMGQLLAGLSVLLGLVVLYGWATGDETLKSVLPGCVTMKANNALCFVLSGGALILGYFMPPAAWARKASMILAACSATIAGFTLLECVSGASLGIDQLLFRDGPNPIFTSQPGRMSPNSAVMHLLFAAAIILLARNRRGIIIAHSLGIIGLFVALLGLVGYLFHAQVFIGFLSQTQIALHTVFGFWMVGIALFCARPKKGLMAAILSDSPGGLIARHLIAPSIVLPLFFGWIAFEGLNRNLYDVGFAASLIVLSSMMIICVLAARSVAELNRIDVERRRLTQRQLNADAREVGAVEASRLKSEFVANVSHELRTPMNGVLGMTSLLLDSDLTREQREHVETIRQSGDALLTLVNEILDFSKIEAGKIVLENKAFSLAACVDEVINLLALNARRNKINLISFIDAHVMPAFLGDAARVRQILINLIGNAIKFTEVGEVTLQISSQPINDDLYNLEFVVSDTGMGISPEALGKLFKPFQQGDASATRKHGGTGLGLTISKSLVQLMGGDISVSSMVGAGSIFKFNVKLRATQLETYVPEDRLPPSSKFIIVAQGGNYPFLMKSQIEAWGGTVVGVMDPISLLKMTETRVTAVLMDRDDDTVALASQMEFDPDWNTVPRMMFDFGDDLPKEREKLFAKRLTKPLKRNHLLINLVELAGGQAALPRMTVPLALSPMSSGGALRILLTEDNHINQKVGLALLSRLGYRADVAANGLEAVDAATRQTYDVILMDIQMPEMGGVEATQIIRKKLGPKAPRIVALTANAFAGAREEYLAQGFDDYLSKPILPPALRQLLQRLIKHVAPEPGASSPNPAS